MVTLDWVIVVLYFVLSAGIGLAYTKKAGESVTEFFVSGRSLPWWLAGTSMVATPCAADTPLAVTGMVASNGVAGNWLWWNMLMSGILTVFFNAHLWRRANVLTDVEFTEIRYSHNSWESKRGDWVERLAKHLRKSTEKALPAGQRMEFNITDIKRAGDYEPWRGPNAQDVRIVRDIYPPRMTFTFIRYGADGQIIDQGERKLADMGFLSSSSSLDSDLLRYEKRMIDDWVRRELKADRELSAR